MRCPRCWRPECRRLRLDLETVRANSAAAIVARVRQTLQDVLAGREPSRAERSAVTSGHFFRGVK